MNSLIEDCEHLCRELGRFLNKHHGKLHIPLQKTLEALEAYLGTETQFPKCPKGGGLLETRKFIDTWNAQGKTEEINEDLYCPNCKVRWIPEQGHHILEA